MTPGLTSVIIPTYDHVAWIGDAIASALAQTAPVEVIVVDDGSTDDTVETLRRTVTDPRVRLFAREHEGPSAARNFGLEQASGEFVMFLDADDVIAPNKVAVQLRAMKPGIGWVLCDVRIEDISGRVQLASRRYKYADKPMGGWIQAWLGAGPFVPIHAPLVRRDAIGAFRFPTDKTPEDWHFWHAVAGEARCAYVPEVLATYRKRPGGRNTGRWRGLMAWPGATRPLRLNLGCGTPGKASWNPQPDMVNLDKSLGWTFEQGLRDFTDASVDGITISHALMFLPTSAWPALFAELARVLRPGGVVRITEDDAVNAASARYGGWRGSEPAVTITDAALVRAHLEAHGLIAHDVTATDTHYRDGSLRQAFHGAPPDVFFIEGVRAAAVLFSPHQDDETLFAAFTILRHRPHVVVCCPSARDYGATETRTAESNAAMAVLGGTDVEQWPDGDLETQMRALDERMRPARVWAPSAQSSHQDHVAVATAAAAVFGERVEYFHTYDKTGKVRSGELVPFEPGWAALKRAALDCYASQIGHPRAKKFFTWDVAEYRA